MKKYLLISVVLGLAACAKPPMQPSAIPLDNQAVVDYQQRVANGKAVKKVKLAEEAPQPLNQSDRTPKVKTITTQPVIYPSIGIGYHRGWGHIHHRHPRYYW